VITLKKAVILCGGRGTRLAPLTDDRQKCMIPLAGKPVLLHVIEHFKRYGVREFLLITGYRKEDVMEFFKDGSQFGIQVAYTICEGGTALSLLAAKPWIKEPFFFAYGDLISDFDLKTLFETHAKNAEKIGTIVTLALLEFPGDVSRFGVAEIENGAKEGKIVKFIEKPSPSETSSRLINAGLMVCSPEVFDHLGNPDDFSFEKQVLPILAKEGKLYGVIMDAKRLWIDIGKYEDYQRARLILEKAMG
jgi:NDP-sugar pyrophosphorylase family protein